MQVKENLMSMNKEIKDSPVNQNFQLENILPEAYGECHVCN